jgi:hypothetical protein
MKEREGAYDFLENPHIKAEALAEGMFAATAKRASGLAYAYVAIDGSSLSLTDGSGVKGFGPVNTQKHRAKGVMVNSALATTPEGTPLGLVDQAFWSRPPTLKLTKSQVIVRNKKRTFAEKEPSEMLRSAKRSIARLGVHGVKAWVVIDRAADNQDILEGLVDSDCFFSVRATHNRYLNKEDRLRDVLDEGSIVGCYEVDIGRSAHRPARRVQLEVRSKCVEVPIRRGKSDERKLTLTAVWVRERSADKDALDWMIYTNVPVCTLAEGQRVVDSYRTRWRIEEFHRTWKSGHCNVEDAQLQSLEALVKWATLLAAVATRIERLKYSSRHHPNQPATSVMETVEIEVLQIFHREGQSKPAAAKPVAAVSVAEVTQWIASMGGWMGKSHGLPGSVTLARGLERLENLVAGFKLAQSLAGRART